MNLIRKRGDAMFAKAVRLNLQNIESLLERESVGRLLDVGCDDGQRTLIFGQAARARELVGVEAVESRALVARRRGIDARVADVAYGLPFEDATFGIVVSNQVIEHVHDTDGFVRECTRVLAPGGLLVISTENLASWHNIVAAALGWQPFSLTNVSACTAGLGNPAALYRHEVHTQPSTWQHVRVFAYRGLIELLQAHGLAVEKTLGAGYFPLPARVGRLDPRHAVFLTVAGRARR